MPSQFNFTEMTTLRRSTRKRTSTTSTKSSPRKKLRKSSTSTTPPPTITSLPYCATKRILQFLDADSLENLSATCIYFDNLLASKFLISIDIPFSVSFIEELQSSKSFDKKPLLKLRCKKSMDELSISEGMSESLSLHKLIVENCSNQYMLYSQMSLLDLSKLKEVDLVPVDDDMSMLVSSDVAAYTSFDCLLLKQISRLGYLSNLTRLDVLVDHTMFLDKFMHLIPNLIQLGLNIMTRTSLSWTAYYLMYLPRLEAVVAASKAPILKISVEVEAKRRVRKVLRNKFVEKLVVKGPCTFNVFPVMERLKEVEVHLVSVNNIPGINVCSYWRSKPTDRLIHRDGLCCVSVACVYKYCPNINKFMGIDVGSVSQNQPFNKCNNKVKKRFYEHYHSQGGSMDIKTWSRTRWFKNQFVLP